MKRSPKKGSKAGSGEHFDERQLTGSDLQLLSDFGRRRSMFERAIEESNIIHHKHTCPACGFPTLDQRYDYDVCVICLWEDGASEATPARIAAPNYTSLVQDRINIAGLFAEFEQTYEIDASLDNVIKSIKSFEERLDAGEVEIDREDFNRHLRNVLPTRELERSS